MIDLLKLTKKRNCQEEDLDKIEEFVKSKGFDIKYKDSPSGILCSYTTLNKITVTMGPYGLKEEARVKVLKEILKTSWYGFHGRKIKVW